MTRWTPAYKATQEQFHTERGDYGVSGHKYANAILSLARSMKTESVLDYGAGKQTLAKSLPFPITSYDPFIFELAHEPAPHDLVVCTDVMEHVEEDYVADVLDHINLLTDKVVFFQIATRPAQKTLPDGRNAHITIHPASWWMSELCHFFEPIQFDNQGGGFIFVGTPKREQPSNTSYGGTA